MVIARSVLAAVCSAAFALGSAAGDFDAKKVLEWFDKNVYGPIPPRPAEERFVLAEEGPAFGGEAVRRQYRILSRNAGVSNLIDVLIYMPPKLTGPVPAFVCPNFYGNHTVTEDEKVFLPSCRPYKGKVLPRGSKASRLCAKDVVARGYLFATYCYGSTYPDVKGDGTPGCQKRDMSGESIWRMFPDVREAHPLAHGAWAWGTMRVRDLLETLPEVDQKRVAVAGHSRMGKSAVIVGAHDTRFALVCANGGGVKPLSILPYDLCIHWFKPKAEPLKYEQSDFLKCIAPRALFISCADDDRSSPATMAMAVTDEAEPAWKAFGGSIGRHRRAGVHAITPDDWKSFLDYAELTLGWKGALHTARIDHISMRWTFGAHEPYTMYRRMGKKSTGGIEGSALWLKDWLDWWDAHAPERMEEFGLNGLHSRFYKGMGWAEERKDLPNVKRFVRNCHAHGVTALAYVQFATLYHEPMSVEIADLESWAQVGYDGEKSIWNGYDFRWMPCILCEEWQEYIERILEIALTEGGFDGIMFDNVFSRPCYCKRCERRFREYMTGLKDPEIRFGFSNLSGVRQPRPQASPKGALADVKDPVRQAWCRWRVDAMNAVMARFRRKIRSVKPDAIISANAHPFRGSINPEAYSLEMISFSDTIDLFMMQSDNFPEMLPGGVIVNRVRDLKIAAGLGKPIVALCDGNAGQYTLDETAYMRPLVEDLVWGGIPTDRTVMSPDRSPTFIDEARFAARKKQMAALNAFASSHRAALSSPSFAPVRILYPTDALMYSMAAHAGITAAEEIFLRNHVPFGYLFARGSGEPTIPADCEVLLVAKQEWLSDAQIAAISDWAKKGGKLVVTGRSGLWNEFGAQRFTNPLESAVKGLPNVAWRAKADEVGGQMGWKYRVSPPEDGGRAMMESLNAVGFAPPVRFERLPQHVFVEIRRLPDGFAVHLVNYNPGKAVKGARIIVPPAATATFEEPFGADTAVRQIAGGLIPSFSQYALIVVREGASL